MHIGIDLDETLIELSFNGYDWKFKDGAIHYVNLLSQQGHLLHIITARTGTIDNREQVEQIAQSLEREGIKIQDVTYTMGNSKGRFAKDLQCICMIDDYSLYMTDCMENNVKPILFCDITSTDRYPGWRVARTWSEIYAHVLSLEEQILLSME